MRRLAICAAAVLLTGCYNYGFRGQKDLLLYGPAPAEEVVRIRKSPDARERREAIVKVVRNETVFSAEERNRLSSRELLSRVASTFHESSDLVRATAVASLRQVGTSEDAPLVLRCLKGDPALGLAPDPSAAVRREAVRALSVLGSAVAIPVLAAVLKTDPDLETRVEAAYAIGRLGTRRAVEPLLSGLSDSSESVVFASYMGLVRVTGQELRPSALEWRRWWKAGKGRPLPDPLPGPFPDIVAGMPQGAAGKESGN